MPELPEVETIKLGLQKRIIGLKIQKIQILSPKSFIGNPNLAEDQIVLKIWRKAKILGVDLGSHSGAKRSEVIESRSYRSASAFLQDDNLKLVIAGSKGWLSDEIYGLPKKLGMEDRVKFLGYVLEKDLPVLYSGAIALTFPSLFEGFGLPILEAQASGCPVLTSNVSSMPEVAGKGAIFVDPYSVDDIVKGMAEIVDEDTKRRIIKAGFENIKRFSWERCARETLKVLEAL